MGALRYMVRGDDDPSPRTLFLYLNGDAPLISCCQRRPRNPLDLPGCQRRQHSPLDLPGCHRSWSSATKSSSASIQT
ncbi:uncharacterized protein LOC110006639 isoform X2 [Amborella trichopoda]|uniref:uncharacterized protein LOC110006639 isoform X2 n=1 Tax=Amborella trichopoda TaxID=13333 RepID=UPI0009BCDB83|nr:uncharacterized protein LOC110006639 isoform X2 [Amborella trichopoda]|eukprot:XP_020518425.1 uncharacterized protein LOC110006639 isoform X2 [Amborella trichopoda]